jgi:hypothetical protein
MKNPLTVIPGVGKSIAGDLNGIGIFLVSDLKGNDPEKLYQAICKKQGVVIDRCLLYVLRCAVYFASNNSHDPELLKWWKWKDRVE